MVERVEVAPKEFARDIECLARGGTVVTCTFIMDKRHEPE